MDEIAFSIDKKYKINKMLGQGYTSKVVHATNLSNNNDVAIKIYIPTLASKFTVKVRKEVEIMEQAKHPNIINIIEHSEGSYFSQDMLLPKEILYSVFNLCDNGDLFDFVKISGALPEKIARHYFKKIINAVKHLHEINIAHCDIKLENLFLTSNYDLILGDFGFAKYIDKDDNLSPYCGTIGYQSPESLERSSHDLKSNDYFAIGVILFIFIFGGSPFGEARASDFRYKYIYSGNFDEFWEKVIKMTKREIVSESLKILLNGILRYKNRFTIEDIEKSSWFNEEQASEQEVIIEMDQRKSDVTEQREEYHLGIELASIAPYFKDN